ncbi:hypothetical protein [Nostoc sp.]|uniref:hypothetical protein n=1 Tax=Nostoc sp. TaxID=1180 RepID=UPI002FFA8C10
MRLRTCVSFRYSSAHRRLALLRIKLSQAVTNLTGSGKVRASPLSPPLRTQHESFPLTALKPYFQPVSTWILINVLAYDTRCVGAEGCLRRPDLPLPQVLCDGFRFPHRCILIHHRHGISSFELERLSSNPSCELSNTNILFQAIADSKVVIVLGAITTLTKKESRVFEKIKY